MISTSSSIDKANIAKSKVFEESVQNNLAANMVSRWKLDEGSGTEAKDSWGSNDGILGSSPSNPIWKTNNDCISGACLSFDGVDDYVTLGPISKYSSYTISFWLNGERGQSVGGILHSDGGSYQRWGVSIEDGKIVSRIADGTNLDIWRIEDYNGINYPAGWHLIVITDNGIKRTFHKDGRYVLDHTNTILNSGEDQTMRLGMGGSTGASRFKGMIDDIRMYSGSLSSSKIKQNYIAGLDSLLSNNVISKQEYNQRLSELALK